MDELFIQIKDGQPYEHPIFEDNFREAFPHIDVNNLPAEFARFKRISCPMNAGEFEVDITTYQWVNGVVQDVWNVRPMTEEERVNYIQLKSMRVNHQAQTLRDLAQHGIDNSPEGVVKNAWVEFKSKMDAWILLDINQPNFPRAPIFDSNGQLLSTNMPSGAPNVID